MNREIEDLRLTLSHGITKTLNGWIHLTGFTIFIEIMVMSMMSQLGLGCFVFDIFKSPVLDLLITMDMNTSDNNIVSDSR